MAMTGWRSDMARWPPSVRGAEQAARAKERRVVGLLVVVAVVLLDALHLVLRAEHEPRALVQARGLDLQHRAVARARAPARLLDDHADRVGFVQQAQAPAPALLALVARIEEHAAAHEDPVRLGDQRRDPAHVEV